MLALLVSHTHWDREWYHGVGRFRQRLVALVDELLDAPPAHQVPFLLDGQAVVLDDYLAVRPDRVGDLSAALRDGRLEAGPWYVLGDELLPGGESLVRNLLAGRRTLQRLGANAPPVLYSPDAFGHAAAMPSLARGFGFGVAIVWRGYGGRRWPTGDAVMWRADDGAAITLLHLPPSGYEFAANLPTHDTAALARWHELRDVLAGRSRLDLLLVQNGADHHALQAHAREAADALGRAAARTGDTLRRATLGDVAREVAARAQQAALPTVHGELRDSYGYAWTLQGTFATRTHQKRAAARVERLLVRDAEPWVALARATRPGGASGVVPALQAAWTTLLRCHPHDTLCGCATDQVAAAMDVRLASAAEQARGLRDDALATLLGHDAAEARERRAAWLPTLVARNAAARTRGGVAEVELLTFVADEPVGPASVAAAPKPRRRWHVADAHVQVLDERVVRDRVESPRHYPDNDLVLRTRAVAWLPPVPACGIATFALGDDVREAPPPAERVRATAHAMDNGRLRVRMDARGGVMLRTADGRTLRDLIGFESVGDVGDTYTHSPVGTPHGDVRFRDARLVARGPLRAALELRYALQVPRARTRTAADARVVTIPLRVRLTLDAGASVLRVAVRGYNRARDHRLRLVLRTDVRAGVVHADAAFGPVRRVPLCVPPADQREEQVVHTAPLHRYVTMADSTRGATLYADGLAEYEAMTDGRLCVTLVRAVGALSRSDLPERRGHAGWPVDTPAAQCQGSFGGAFAILPHGPRDDHAIIAIEATADDVLLPLRATTLRSALHRPASVDGVALHGDGLALTAILPTDDGAATVLRCVNLLPHAVAGAWALGWTPGSAARARLDETVLAPLAVHGRRIAFEAGPREIVTIVVR